MNNDSVAAHTYNDIYAPKNTKLDKTIIEALKYQAETHGDLVYLTSIENGVTTELTFSELDILVERGATYLSKLVSRCDTVALLLKNDSLGVIAVLSLVRLGIPVLLVDPSSPEKRINDLIETANVNVVIDAGTASDFKSKLVFPPLEAIARIEIVQISLPSPESQVFLIPTSGSTSKSKVVSQSHRAITSNALAIVQHLSLKPGIRFLGCLPIHHVNGLHLTIIANLFGGSEAILLNGFSPFKFPRYLQKFNPHIVSVVPSILESMLVTCRIKKLGNSLRYFISAAAPLPSKTARLIWERWGVMIIQGYGLSETINFSAMMPTELNFEKYSKFILNAQTPSIGEAISGNDIVIISSGKIVECDFIEGEICIRGHNLMDFYVSNEHETIAAFRGGYFHTGDLGMFETTESGRRFYTITGRLKNIVNISGETISLEEVERVVLKTRGVSDCASVGLIDRFSGERIVILYSGRENLVSEICSRIRAELPCSTHNSEIYYMSNIPRTPTGKLIRKEIEDLAKIKSKVS